MLRTAANQNLDQRSLRFNPGFGLLVCLGRASAATNTFGVNVAECHSVPAPLGPIVGSLGLIEPIDVTASAEIARGATRSSFQGGGRAIRVNAREQDNKIGRHPANSPGISELRYISRIEKSRKGRSRPLDPAHGTMTRDAWPEWMAPVPEVKYVDSSMSTPAKLRLQAGR